MANEITITKSIVINNPPHKETINPGQIRIDQNAIGIEAPIVIVGTTEENLDPGDIGTEGILIIQNLDDTNYVRYGVDDSGTMKGLGRLKAGECHDFRLDPGVTLRWVANTADVKVKVWLLED